MRNQSLRAIAVEKICKKKLREVSRGRTRRVRVDELCLL
jgi:hypothetical protein